MNLGLLQHAGGDMRLQRPMLQEASLPFLTPQRGHLLFPEDLISIALWVKVGTSFLQCKGLQEQLDPEFTQGVGH